MTAPANPDPYTEVLKRLLKDIQELKDSVETHANLRLQKYKTQYRSAAFTKSARNLAHYLALRQFDLRNLQERLAQAGLSSLGRAEASVMSTLDALTDILQRATDSDYCCGDKSPSEYGFHRGQQLLEQHTIELFGPFHPNSKVHIMVTLPTEAAWDYTLVSALLAKGMTCARINCAHDDAGIWQGMIANIRRAEIETGQSCRILMDLAGHKIRTAEVELEPPVRHIKTRKDPFGAMVSPGYLMIVKSGSETQANNGNYGAPFSLAVPEKIFELLTLGSVLAVIDARHKQRYFSVERAISDCQWLVSCKLGCYLQPGAEISVYKSVPAEGDKPLASFTVPEFPGSEKRIRLFKNEVLQLTENTIPGAPAQVDETGCITKPAHIGCTLSSFSDKLKPGHPVWIDDGKLGAVVERVDADGALLRVTHARAEGVTIQSDKGINFPETPLDLPPLSEKDLMDLNFACVHADMVGFSFVETLADMDYLIEELAKRNATDLPIVAKIETNTAVKNLPDIILGTIGRHSLGIMIARGDLAVELGSARLAEIQEELLWLCEAGHVPVIWATQVLESIAKKGVRSRPEFTDAAMAVRAECVMLNKGPYILEAIEALINVMMRMQEHQRKKFPRLRALHW
ncbi:MAG: pyruvate kinase [Methylobacter sp.]|nr:MAG: pyruvate kinase [Methylobacter sp.]